MRAEFGVGSPDPADGVPQPGGYSLACFLAFRAEVALTAAEAGRGAQFPEQELTFGDGAVGSSGVSGPVGAVELGGQFGEPSPVGGTGLQVENSVGARYRPASAEQFGDMDLPAWRGEQDGEVTHALPVSDQYLPASRQALSTAGSPEARASRTARSARLTGRDRRRCW